MGIKKDPVSRPDLARCIYFLKSVIESLPSMYYHAGCGDNTAYNTSPAWLKSKGDDFYRSGDYHRFAFVAKIVRHRTNCSSSG